MDQAQCASVLCASAQRHRRCAGRPDAQLTFQRWFAASPIDPGVCTSYWVPVVPARAQRRRRSAAPQVSDAILDACLEQDPLSKVRLEVV